MGVESPTLSVGGTTGGFREKAYSGPESERKKGKGLKKEKRSKKTPNLTGGESWGEGINQAYFQRSWRRDYQKTPSI